VLSGIVTVRSFAREDDEAHRFLSEVEGANHVVEQGVGRDSVVGGLQSLVAALARIAVIALGGWLVLRGETTVGTVVAFLGYVAGLFVPVRGLSTLYTNVCKASASLDVVLSILDASEPVTDAPGAVAVPQVEGHVLFRGVRFRYGEAGPWVLDGIDLDVRPAETVALVGASGAGKSTLMALLQRQHDPVEGTIELDGRDLRSIRQQSFRRHLGVVLQDALLFNDTVRNNIAYARPGAPLEAVIEAARAANAHDFILKLPEGYHTVIGEHGGRLSAGERQRIAIARALLKDPKLVILDEATSALDAETEFLVQSALDKLVEGSTTFIIAHRLSTVVSADRILVLKDGRIAEEGTHAELLRRCGHYAGFVRMQTHGLLP
jgi:ATP-binding cassette subfamily B protein